MGAAASVDGAAPGRMAPRSPGDARVELISTVLTFVMTIGILVLLVGAFVSPAVWASGTAVFVLTGSILWLLGKTPAGRRNTARHERDATRHARMRARTAAHAEQKRQAAAADIAERRTREAARTLQRAVQELLDDLPARGTPQDQAIAHCLEKTLGARDPRLQAEAERLTRRHVAVDERILCVAQSETEGNARPALLILTERGAAVSDKGISYRFDPQPEDVSDPTEWSGGHLTVGELIFRFFRYPRLRVALAAREEAAAAAPPADSVHRPAQRLIRDARDAELAAVDWMCYLGFTDAVATPVGADEGIDVLAERAVAQVKKEGSPTTRPTVQQLHGVATAKQRAALFFSMAGYTHPAIAWASQQGIALFQYDLQGTPQPVNPPALSLLEAADKQASRAAGAHAATPTDTIDGTAAP
ncbi:restriction endonuclease [Streptomyces tropicalis]|uniref:Restriction endonuclease n=1 Tax=Streptomyces tropicalis TaxID=3034234 RepID=A0ABT5ZZQ2_9ACTN|nr:restriction endonuclease [Streptomyces tropicalis]MDF3297864.1 restriction endonuclease [Streptomyces tropicalis]